CVVGLLVLEEDRAAAFAVPLHVVLVEVLDEQAGGEHVVAVDDHAVVAAVGLPADAVAVVGAPHPGVVDDGVPGVDHHGGGGPAGARAADPDEHVLHGDGVGRVVAGGALGPDFEQDGGVDGAGVDQEAGQPYAV